MTEELEFKLRCADLADGILYEIARDEYTMAIAKIVHRMDMEGTLECPSEEDLAEMQRLTKARNDLAFVKTDDWGNL
jgi:hypothetical protein